MTLGQLESALRGIPNHPVLHIEYDGRYGVWNVSLWTRFKRMNCQDASLTEAVNKLLTYKQKG